MKLLAKLREIAYWQKRKWTTILHCKSVALLRHVKNRQTKRTVLFYPEMPLPYSAIYKICHRSNCRIIGNTNKEFDLAINWDQKTKRDHDQTICTIRAQGRMLNSECVNVGKIHISEVFQEIFGYPLAIDPAAHRGTCVRKSDVNAVHDGTLVECPIAIADPNCVYQIVVNNSDGEMVEDIRICVMNDAIPLAYLKRRQLSNRFSNENTSVSLSTAEELLSPDEMKRVVQFCEKIGLNYGELDVLRDRDSNLLYIVDANPTPFGPPNHLNHRDGVLAMERMAAEFARQFF